jgi:hypothetical protein
MTKKTMKEYCVMISYDMTRNPFSTMRNSLQQSIRQVLPSPIHSDIGKETIRLFWGVPVAAALMIPALALSPISVTAQTYTTNDLEIDFIRAYDEVWKDKGSGADRDVSFWRPTPPAGWHRVGHHAKSGYSYPTDSVMIVKERTSGTLAKPTGYTLIWKDAGSGADRDASVWRPKCPDSYKALGDVTNGSHGQPSTNEVRCIRTSALEAALPGGFIWNDAGSGADADFGAWGIQPPTTDATYGYLTRGLFYGAASHSRPANNSVAVLWAIKIPARSDAQRAGLISDALLFDYTQVFQWVWDDKGSGAHRDVGFFRPVPRPGYYALGHYAHASHATPTDIVIVVKEKQPGALAAPLNYEWIWNDAGSGANRDGAVWWPVCPSNYVALGLVTSSGNKPSTNEVRCVRQDLTAQAQVGDQIWNDSGSGAKRDFAAWRIKANSAPPGEGYLAPGGFIGHASHGQIGNAGARALKIKLPLFKNTQPFHAPQLSGYGRPSDFESQTVTSEIYLPFTAVKDPLWSPVKMAKDSPYYKLIRTDRFKLIDHIYNQTSTDQSVKWRYTIALQNSESFTHQTGVSLTAGYQNQPGGVGYSASVTVSYSFTYQTARSKTETTFIEVPVTAKPGKAVAAYTVQSTFQLYRADGSPVGTSASANQDSFVFAEYPSGK